MNKTTSHNQRSKCDHQEPDSPHLSKRKIIASIGLTSGVFGATALSQNWVKPAVNSVILPAHAQTTNATQPPAATTQPPAATTQPPAATTQPPAATTQPPAATTQPPASLSPGSRAEFYGRFNEALRTQGVAGFGTIQLNSDGTLPDGQTISGITTSNATWTYDTGQNTGVFRVTQGALEVTIELTFDTERSGTATVFDNINNTPTDHDWDLSTPGSGPTEPPPATTTTQAPTLPPPSDPNTFEVGDAIPDFPSGGTFNFEVLRLNGATYTCQSSGGCQIVDKVVTRGTIVRS